MDLIRTLFSRCAALFGRHKLDADLDEELRAHIDLAIEENAQSDVEALARKTLAWTGMFLALGKARASIRCDPATRSPKKPGGAIPATVNGCVCT
jgi:hypothetical protein